MDARLKLLNMFMQKKTNQKDLSTTKPTAGGGPQSVRRPANSAEHAGRNQLLGLHKSFSEMIVKPNTKPLKQASPAQAHIDNKLDVSLEDLAQMRSFSNYGSHDNMRLEFDYDYYVSDLDSGSDSETSMDRLRREMKMFEESLEFPRSVAEKLALNTVVAARVSDVNAPSKFWLQLQKYDDELDRLHSELK